MKRFPQAPLENVRAPDGAKDPLKESLLNALAGVIFLGFLCAIAWGLIGIASGLATLARAEVVSIVGEVVAAKAICAAPTIDGGVR